jgi:taurine dioxygenase
MTWSIHAAGKSLGAEIRGIDLASPIAHDGLCALRAAWLEHMVLVFRDQRIDMEEHLRFARYFGELEEVKTNRKHPPGQPAVMFVANQTVDGVPGVLPNGEMLFHSDQCYYECPIMATTLYAITVPREGGNTIFANAHLAYRLLSEELKGRIEGLQAVNVYDYERNATMNAAPSRPEAPRFTHPVVRTHPETGRRAIYVNRLMTDHVVDLSQEDSRRILDLLFAAVEREDHLFEHAWRPGDLLMWDNRCVQHARRDFDPAQPRVLRRIAVRGDRPLQ